MKGCENDLLPCAEGRSLQPRVEGGGQEAEASSVTWARDAGCLNQPLVGARVGDVQEINMSLAHGAVKGEGRRPAVCVEPALLGAAEEDQI